MIELTFIQKIRNKIKIEGTNNSILVDDPKSLSMKNSKIILKGQSNKLKGVAT